MDPGFYILGITPDEDRDDESEFSVLFNTGIAPVDNQVKLAANYCPSGRAPDETGEFDRCAKLDCLQCTGPYGTKEGCAWCTGGGRAECVTGESCPLLRFGVKPEIATTQSACSVCDLGSCESCRANKRCRYCEGSFAGSSFNVCLEQSCASQADAKETCAADTRTTFNLDNTFPPTPTQPTRSTTAGSGGGGVTTVASSAAAQRSGALAVVAGALAVIVQQ